MQGIIFGVRRTFLAGLIVWIPIVVTLLVFKVLFQWVDQLLGPAILKLLTYAGAPIGPDFQAPGLGLVSTLIIIFFTGMFTANYFGKKLLEFSEWALSHIPILSSVYNGAKQVMSAIASTGSQSFSQVVLVEYPRKGVFSMAFITGDTRGEAAHKLGTESINIFMPTTPNPTTGFFMMVPKEDLVMLDMPVEDGLKMLISGGLVTPEWPPPKGKAKKTEKEDEDS